MSAQPAAPPEMPHGTLMHGPSALGGDPRRFLHLTWTLAVLEFRLKFFGSVLGYLWQVMKPLALFGVMFVVFSEFAKLGGGVKNYPQILLLGIVLFTFFQEATSNAVRCVVAQEGIVRKIQFPRMVIPLSVVLTAFFNLLLNMVTVAVFVVATRIPITVRWLELIPLVVILVLTSLGVAMLVSALYVRYRDIAPIWDVVSQALFYITPILYPIEKVPNEQLHRLLLFNPLGYVTQQSRHALFHTPPSAAEMMGGLKWAAIPIAFSLVLFILGLWVFNREAPRVAEDL